MGQRVELEPARLECAVGAAAAQERLKPRDELDEREWLREVVVATRVEAGDAVDDCITSGQKEHRSLHAARAERLAQVAPVSVGQADVDHEHVRHRPLHRLECIRPRRGRVDREAFLAEPASEHAAQLLVVLDEQNGSP